MSPHFFFDLFTIIIAFFTYIILPVGFIFWIWMLVDLAQNQVLSEPEKLRWTIMLVFTSFIGAGIYYFVGRPKSRPSP